MRMPDWELTLEIIKTAIVIVVVLILEICIDLSFHIWRTWRHLKE